MANSDGQQMKGTHLLGISYSKNAFDQHTEDAKRMRRIANVLAAYHLIVFTRKSDGFSEKTLGGKFILHPTNSRTRVGMVIDAVRIGRKVIHETTHTRWAITAQDPFEAGFVGFLIRFFSQKNVPLNIQEHGNFFGHPYWKREKLSNVLRSFFGRILLKQADTIRVVSERIKQSLRDLGVPEEKMAVLPVSTDISRFLNTQPDTSLRKKIGESSLIVLTVARFVPQKNLSLLLRAFSRMAKDDKTYHLVIVGRGTEESALKTLADSLGMQEQILFLPWSEDVPGLFAAADIYALSSNYEGWGRVLIEAMAAGLPIVTTDVGCVGEVVRDKQQAEVVPRGDVTAYADALRTLSQDEEKRKEYGRAGKETAALLAKRHENTYVAEWVDAHIPRDERV